MKLTFPELSLVVLIGCSSSGKSTFAKKHFKQTEIISSDTCRALISDDENNQLVSKEAFELLHFIISKRLKLGKLTVVDATNVQESARKSLIDLAREYHVIPTAIVFNLPERVCQERNKERIDRNFKEHVIKNQISQLNKSFRTLKKEGFKNIYVLNNIDEVNSVEIERQPLWNNLKHIYGPFDIIGDIHGCFDELKSLLIKVGYIFTNNEEVYHPEGRKVIFLGDLVDRGPKIVEVLKLVMNMVKQNKALCVPGNHDIKLLKKLSGKNVQITHGLEETLEQLETQSESFKEEVRVFLDGLVSHYVLDEGKLVVAHAGMKEEFQGRGSSRVRDFALYGETTGEIDEYGLPVRVNWAQDYRGKALVVYGHTPIPEAIFINNTINIDTGCVFGGKLTALRYPERELVNVNAIEEYYKSARPLNIVENNVENRNDYDLLDIKDVLGKKIIETKLYNNITIQEENAISALEVMSRFAADPHWLIYLPPTMSPTETSKEEGILEHPKEAFEYYKKHDVEKVVCEEKHMGSRAIFVVCKDEIVARKRFGIKDGSNGICYTRTGKHFFDDQGFEKDLLNRIIGILNKSNFWNDFKTDWVCLDTELMPWSIKAQTLLKDQYAKVGIAGKVSLAETIKILEQSKNNNYTSFDVSKDTSGQNLDILNLLDKTNERYDDILKYIEAYRRYCWKVDSIDDLKIAPFHILATEGNVHIDKNHIWHLETIKKYMANYDEIIIATNHKIVDLSNSNSIEDGIKWWKNLTNSGGEGMVVKPFDFVTTHNNTLIQPAVKCRGKEYLRIIYGPEYTMEENIIRLKNRSVGKKRSLALREFALGIEGLSRFVNYDPLYRVHECVFGVLALESEPVDPRL